MRNNLVLYTAITFGTISTMMVVGCPPSQLEIQTNRPAYISALIKDLENTPEARVLLSKNVRHRLMSIAIPAEVKIDESGESIVLAGPGKSVALVYERMFPLPDIEKASR